MPSTFYVKHARSTTENELVAPQIIAFNVVSDSNTLMLRVQSPGERNGNSLRFRATPAGIFIAQSIARQRNCHRVKRRELNDMFYLI